MLTKSLALAAIILLILLAGAYIAIQVNPWPSALFVRREMDRGGIALAQALEKHIPVGVVSRLNEHYDTSDPDAFLDIFTASGEESPHSMLPTVVWIHGGGWISGSKDQIANYLKILAAKGFTTVGVDYSLAPGRVYPTPLSQVNRALAYIGLNAARFHVDPSKLVLAGDSSGAQIAAQLAAIVSVPSYAKAVGIIPAIDRAQLRGVILYCGFYDGETKKNVKPWLWSNIRTMLWSYFGTKRFLNDPRLLQFSVTQHITEDFPPMFISVGNGDDLAPQSLALAEIAAMRGVVVDSLFFPKDYTPPPSHEFQFNLDSDAGRLALQRSTKFLTDQSR